MGAHFELAARYLCIGWKPTPNVTADTAMLDVKDVPNNQTDSHEEMTMNENVPYIWRVNYRNNLAQPEKVLDIAHRKAREFLSRAGMRSSTR